MPKIWRFLFSAEFCHKKLFTYKQDTYKQTKGRFGSPHCEKQEDIALLYRYRWQVELFFKWIKQHLRVKRFWGDSENAVRIHIHVAIITYCLVAIIEHDLKLDRPIFEVMRILGSSLLVKDDILELLNGRQDVMDDSGQLELEFNC